jgi:hypothetical protein
MEIDLVYLWVDGSDSEWMARKRAFFGNDSQKGPGDGSLCKGSSEADCKGRWCDNDELRYSLRSVEAFAPWIRKIFIVTDGQTPAWLDTDNPRVQIVDHAGIMPREALPCFNASVIEHYLWRIPDLGERFLFANDDMFLGAPVEPGFFFAPDGRPFVRLTPKMFGKLRLALKRAFGKGLSHYRRMLFDSARRVEELTGKYYSGIPHHNIDAYTRDDYRHAVEVVFRDAVAASATHHIRTDGDFHRSAIGLWTLATGRARMKYVISKSEGLRLRVRNPDGFKAILRHSPRLFCINDDQYSSDSDRARIRPFLETLFPDPSSFEKGVR